MKDTLEKMLAATFSDTFWDMVGYKNFCIGCSERGADDVEEGCPACDDIFSSECPRHKDAEELERRIQEFAASLYKDAVA